MTKRLTVAEFIKKANEIHGNYYNYSKIKYVYATDKVPIICPKHGEFQQSPIKHLSGQGCKECSIERSSHIRRSTKEEFVEKAKSIHGDKYDYSQVDYKGNHTNVTIICPDHGPFQQMPSNHTHKTKPQGCPGCSGRTPWNKELFIGRAESIHGKGRYDYSKVIFKDTITKMIIKCPEHGEFEQSAQHHINRKQGCPKCAGTAKKSTDEFVHKANDIHGNRYDYSKAVYIGNHNKVCIICPEHGEFWQTPANHTRKTKPQGCPECSGRTPWNKELFIGRAESIHGKGRYDYSKVIFKDTITKMIIICPFHGEFEQDIQHHINRKQGCPKCLSPKGETKIREILNDKKLRFEEQVSFDDCKDKNLLKFDFVVYKDDRQLIIEYHGAQHYGHVSFGGKSGQDDLELIKRRDSIKREWCCNRHIPLLEISYSVQIDHISDMISLFIDNPRNSYRREQER